MTGANIETAVASRDLPQRKSLRMLIPLDGSDCDASVLLVATEMIARDAELHLLLARAGPDEEQYPDLRKGLSETERIERHLENERIFARANAMLASRGLVSAGQLTAQGKPAEIILRVANIMGAELLVLSASSARHVIDQASCAVLVAGLGAARGERHG